MRRSWIGSLLLLIPLCLSGQAEKLVPYRLQHTDRILVETIDGEYVTHLTGNVHFYYGKIEFRTDQADIYDQQNLARMTGNVSATNDTVRIYADRAVYFRGPAELYVDDRVRAYKDTLTFTGDHGVYYRNQDRLLVTGNAVYTETHADTTRRTIEADQVDYLRADEKVTAVGRVRAYDEREKLRGTCGFLEYDLKNGYGYLLREPSVWLEGKDSLFIEADKMEYFRDDRKLVANFDVKTWNRDYRSTSDFLIFFLKTEEAVFLGEPEFHLDQADAWAREFHVFFKDKKVDGANLRDSCRVIFSGEEGEPRTDRVISDQMDFFFTDGDLRHCTASGNVDSHIRQEHKGKREFIDNKTRGGSMEVFIDDDDKIDRVIVRQKVTGAHQFEKK
jgi:lipopolysaccharide export system protein LptA